MKKSLLVISVILLIAGLFIACNSEAAESSNSLVEVKFADDNSKAISSSTTTSSGTAPSIENQYWWYKASKTTPGGSTGATTTWTRVSTLKGLADKSVGRFSLGGWHFDLVAVAYSNVIPTDEMYESGAGLVFWGNTNTTLASNSTTVSVTLNWHAPTTGTVEIGSVTLLNNTVACDVTWSYKVYFDSGLAKSENISMLTTGNIILENMTVASGVTPGTHSVRIDVLDDNAVMMYSATKDFVVFPGSTVTISGSLDELLTEEEIEFNGTAASQPTYVAAVSGSGYYEAFTSMDDAINAVTAETNLVLLTDWTLSGDVTLASAIKVPSGFNITIDLNGHSITIQDNNEITGDGIINDGTLTLTDSSTGTPGVVTALHDTVANYGSLTINGGKYVSQYHDEDDGNAVKNFITGTAIINGGTFEGRCAFNNLGTATVNDGVFNGNACSAVTAHNHTGWGNDNYVYAVRSIGTITINGGTVNGVHGALGISKGTGTVTGGSFTTVQCSSKTSASDKSGMFYPLYVAGEYGEVSVTVTGGTFTQNGSYVVVCVGNDNHLDGGDNEQATLIVEGGTFIQTNSQNIFNVPNLTGNPSVRGGEYSKQPNRVDTEHYEIVASSTTTGYYTVRAK